MKDNKVTDNNVDVYRKFLKVKKGKMTLNQFNVLLPVVLCFIEVIGVETFLIFNPLFTLNMSELSALLVKLLLFGGVVLTTVKLNFELSKTMNMGTFKKQHPDFDTSMSIDEVEKKLKEYQIKNTPDYSMYKRSTYDYPRVTSDKKNDNFKKNSSQERLSFLKKEKQFLIGYKVQTEEEKEKGKQKKKKF